MPDREREAAAAGWPREQDDAGDAPAAAGLHGQEQPAAAPHSDEQLMAAFCGGDDACFEALFKRYKQPVFGFFRRRVAERTRAEELTQECFLALLRAGERYRPEASFRTFLYAIALNLLRADRRKTAFRALWSGSPPEADMADPHGDTEVAVLMRDALRRLEQQDRDVLMLRTYEELSYAEIAELLRMPVNTVRSRLFRARAALRELLTRPRSAKQTQHTLDRNGQGKERA